VPSAVFDLANTGWCARQGAGVGEALTIALPAGVEIGHLLVPVGMRRGGAPKPDWNLPTRLAITFDDGEPFSVVPDAQGIAELDLDDPIAVRTVRIEIAEVTTAEHEATCLGTIDLGRARYDDALLFPTSDPRGVKSFAKGYAAVATALRACKRKAVARAAVFPLDDETDIVGVEPPTDPAVKRYATAAAWVAARCRPRLPRPADVRCSRDGLDRMSCEADSDDGAVTTGWDLAWSREKWRLVRIDRTVLVGE
jgi:hypothetical protein